MKDCRRCAWCVGRQFLVMWGELVFQQVALLRYLVMCCNLVHAYFYI
jgi:hypothetical protein